MSDFLNHIVEAERLTLNLTHTSGAAQMKDMEEGDLPLPASLTLTGKFICPVSADSIKSNFFRISTQAEDQQLSRNSDGTAETSRPVN